MRFLSMSCVAALLVSGAATASTTTLFDDDFAAEVADATSTVQTVNFTGLENWNITDGTVDLFTNGGFGLPCGSTGCLDLDGSSNNAGRIETMTAFSFLSGATYSLSVDFSGRNGGGTEMVSFGVVGLLSEMLTFAPNDPTDVTETLTFTALADGMGSLFIDHAGGDNFGMLLDRVTLTQTVTSAVPLPAAGWLLLAAMGGLGVARRRRS